VPGTEHLHDQEHDSHDHDDSYVNGHDESLVEENAG
jgi:hypothetical protein